MTTRRHEIMSAAIPALAVEFIGDLTGLRPPVEKEAIPLKQRIAFDRLHAGLVQLAKEEAHALSESDVEAVAKALSRHRFHGRPGLTEEFIESFVEDDWPDYVGQARAALLAAHHGA